MFLKVCFLTPLLQNHLQGQLPACAGMTFVNVEVCKYVGIINKIDYPTPWPLNIPF